MTFTERCVGRVLQPKLVFALVVRVSHCTDRRCDKKKMKPTPIKIIVEDKVIEMRHYIHFRIDHLCKLVKIQLNSEHLKLKHAWVFVTIKLRRA